MNMNMSMKTLLTMFLACVLAVSVTMTGCSFKTSDEVVDILNLMAPAVEGIVPIVAITDPAMSVGVQNAVNVFEAAVKETTTAYQNWKSASQGAQPGALAQLQATVSSLKSDLTGVLGAARVTNATHASVIDGIVSTVLDEIANIAGVIGQVQAAGGTTTAASKLILHDMYGGGEESSAGQSAEVSKKSTKVHQTAHSAHSAHPVHSAKYFRSELRKHLSHKTGDARLDAVNAQTVAKIK